MMATGRGPTEWVAAQDERPASRLTPRQEEALRMYAVLGNYKDAAKALGISPQTLKNHLWAAYRTLGVSNVIEALTVRGWLVVPLPYHYPPEIVTVSWWPLATTWTA